MKTPVIICVDDDKTILNSLEMELMNVLGEQYLIETAESGLDALEIIDELLAEKIELPLVISDQIMPSMKGDELLTQVHAISPKTLTILLTGQADAEAVGRAVNSANLYRYIPKPWESTDLSMTVTKALKSYFQEKKLTLFYASLEQKTSELQQKNEFLSIAVHDLKNPLSAIQGFSDMIKSDFADTSEEIIEIADMIAMTSQQMFELVRNLLEVNAIESRKMDISLTVFDILPTLQWVINQYIERAKAKKITLHCHFQKPAYQALCNRDLLRQVFDNLISNAIKYSPIGKTIDIRLKQDDNSVRCEIQDEGPGLSLADQQKLFGQFTRLTPQPTGGEHSTGLGLFIVKKLVESQQGRVWCESLEGQGATFIVQLKL
ncbi:MAG: hybrid sensor histidine kinase/response regulator [Candidatus Parabeggiatoa sp.]|nr:hybrid sensor histidine kinase/response regulator [Candidatus Parabeggiatoa sp.]